MRKVYLLLFALLCISSISFAQLSGSKNIPGDYADINSAVTALNAQGVGAGGVTFNVIAGHTENTAAIITITATGTAANPIVFQKSGAGANPVITRTDAGALITTTLGAQGDAVVMIEGSDYLTFDGIDVSASNMGVEYGYYLRKASVTDGCKNVTIKNAAITMTKGTSEFVVGIYSSNNSSASTLTSATGITVTSTGGRNENLVFNGNIIKNVFAGIIMRGYNHTTVPRDFADQNNTVGAVGAGNIIQNFAGNFAATSYGIYGIYQNDWNVSYNTIENAVGGTAATSLLYGIFASTGTTFNWVVNNNIVNLVSSSTSSSLYGIYNSSMTGNLAMDNNTVTLNNTAASSGTYAFLYNGSATAATQISMSNNTFGNSTFNTTGTTYLIYNSNTYAAIANINNNVTGTINRTGATGTMYGYYNLSSPTGTDNISGNNFQNITMNSTSSAAFTGIHLNTTANHTANIFNNVIGNVSTGSGLLTGISLTAANVRNIYGNSVHSLTGTGTVVGINSTSGFTAGAIYGNKIYNITSSANSTTAPYVSGILVTSGTSVVIHNNLIGDLKSPAANSPDAIRGINLTTSSTSTTVELYFNTVHLDAASSATNFGTTGVYHTASATATTAALTMKNNIIVNNSTSNGSGKTVAFRRSSAALNTLNNYATASNNNLFYAGASGVNNLLYYNGTEGAETLADYKSFTATSGTMAPRDAASVSGNPPFLSLNGADATFLHINPAIPTQVESGGTPVTGITTDFDGNTRDASTPDIGADEGAFTISDISGPAITYNLINNTGCLTAPTLSATITDASDVNVTAGTKPRLYFKRNTDNNAWVDNTNTSNGWKYVEASNATSPFTFTVNYSLLFGGTGVAAGQTMEYFVVAQDLASPVNVAINSGVFNATPASVNLTAGAFPITGTINTYNIVGGINTSVTIGAAGTYPTLTGTGGLFEAINTNGLSANTVAEIIDAAITETGTVALNQIIYGCTANSTLTIRPAAGMATVLSGTSGTSASALIKLNGADYVTFDGINTGGSSLLIENTSITGGTAVVWLASQGANNGATNNTIKNTSIKAGVNMATAATVTYGIVIAGNIISATLSSVTAGPDNDNNRIEGNTFIKARYGLYIRGGSAADPNTGTVVSNNTFGPAAFGAESIGKGAIVVREENGIQITNNLIQNIGGDFANTSAGADRVGISLAADASWTPSAVFVSNAVVTNNIITNVIDERTFSAAGIVIAGADGTNATNNLVANNMISSVRGNGTTGDQAVGLGISAGNGDKVVFNTINLFGDIDPGTTTAATGSSAAVIISSNTAVSNLTLKNNIISVDLTSNTTTLKHYTIVAPSTAFAWGTGGSDHNLYYFPTANTQMAHGGIGTSSTTYTAVNTLADWKTSFTPNQDANSTGSIEPVFVSATDLHLVPGANALIDNLGTPITGVNLDIDGNTRNVTTPDMGADEFTAPACTGAVGGTASAPTTAYCATGAPTITATGYSTGAASGYQWQSSADLAFTTPTDIAGQTNPAALTLAAPVTTTTYYRLRVTCTTAPLEAYSNIITITINPNPVVAISPAGPVTACAGSAVVLTASGTADTYAWSPATGLNVTTGATVTATSTSAITYTVIGTITATGCSNTANVTINRHPEMFVTAAATPATVCSGAAVSLSATAAYATTATIGTQTTTIGGVNGNPYRAGNGAGNQIKTQLLVLASELNTAGIAAGNINSLGFTTTTSTGTLADFNIRLAPTTATVITTTFETATWTSVFNQATFTPVPNTTNVHVFQTPFVWDGVSNVLIEVCQTNSISGTSTVAAHNPGFNANVHAAGSATACSNATGTVVANRPIMTFGYSADLTSTATWSWSDGTTNVAATANATVNPVNNTTAPLNITYTATATNTSTGCAVSNSGIVTVNPATRGGMIAGSTSVCTGTNSGNLTLSGHVGAVVKWQSSINNINFTDLPANTGTTESYTNLTQTTYYRAIVKFGTCADAYSDTATITVSTVSDAGTLNGNQTICISGTPNDIIASGITGNVVRWESSSDAAFTTPATIANTTTTLSPGALTATTYYRVVVKSGACSEVSSTTPVMITVNSTITPSMSLAGTAGGTQLCSSHDVAASANFFAGNCDIIATVTPSGAAPVSGSVNACVKVESAVPTAAGTNEPYVARHYNIIPATNAATATSTITLYFLQSEFDAFNTARGFYAALPTGTADNAGKANLRVSMFPGSATTPGTAGGTQLDPADADINFADGRWSVSFAATGSGSFFVHTGNFTLPVTLVNFRGEQSGNTNKLLWSTSTEIDNRGFELERSSDGRNYSSITFVASKAENGNSNSTLNYNYNDVRPLAGNNYYRLKQVDKDGKTTFSNVVLLSSKVADITLSSVYPNPTTRELNLVITSPKAEKVTVIVTDLTGKVLMQTATLLVIGDNQQTFNVQQLAAGTYFIKAVCANGCETAVQRFVKQ